MDLVKIGFQINANGLKDANTEVDKLLNKVDNIGTKGKKASSDFESSQKKVSTSLGKTKKSNEDVLDVQNKQIAAYNKLVNLEQTRAKYISQGFGKTDSNRIARMEISGADAATLDTYKRAIEETNKAVQALNPTIEKATTSHNKFLDQVKGIAIYAALSAAIYGVMTAMTSLAVATVKMADEYTAIQNRMKLYVKDADTLIEVNQKLAEYSMENNVGLRETSTLFARLAPSMQRLGRSTQDITTVVDAFGKSMRIGGATAMEAASATIQFSQAMASGKLAGDEFRSISEASPRFLQAIAEGSGIAAAKLKEMSAAGLLTTEVITNALIKSYGKLSDENSRLGITLEQGANAIKTAFTVAIGEFNEGAGITRFFGESLMDLAISFKELSTSAKTNGEAFKQWISDNEKNIALLGKTAALVASIMIGKLVASFTAVMLAAIKVRVQTLALNASILLMGNTARSATGLMNGLAVAISRISFTGWVGIAATVASVALGFSAFKESTSEATTELVSHNKYVAMTTEELKALGVVQRDLAKFKLNMDLSEAEKNVKSAKDEMVKALDDVIYKWNFIKKVGDNGFVEQYDAIIASVKSGQTSYDQAIKQLSDLGAVTPETAKELSKMAGEYDKTVDAMLPLVKVLDTLGVKHKLTKDATANGKTENELYKKGLDDLKSSAIDAGDAVGGLAEKYKKASDILAGGIKIGKITGIMDKSVAEELYKEADEVAKNLQDRLIFKNPKGITAQSLIESGMFAENIKGARELLKLQKQSSDFFQEDKSLENKKKATESYQEQVGYVGRLNNLLKQGVDYETAKVVAEKDYSRYITGNGLAIEIVQAKQLQARIEYLASLGAEEELQGRINGLLKIGATYEQARALAESKFTDNAQGRSALEQTITNDLFNQNQQLDDMISQQSSINTYLAKGKTLEEATMEVTKARLQMISDGNLNDEQKALTKAVVQQQLKLKALGKEQEMLNTLNTLEKQKIAFVSAQVGGYSELAQNIAIANKVASNTEMTSAQAKRLLEAEELLNFEKELSDLKRQTYILTLNESDAVKQLLGNYTTLDSVKIAQLSRQQRLLEVAKELSDEAEKQRNNPLGDFSNVDFSVFGDFGNPFESALNGLNEFVTKTQESRGLLASLEKDIAVAKQAGLDVTDLELEKNQLLTKQEQDRSKAIDQGITNALSLTKSMFNEESKGYKVVSKLEKAYQASKIAFALWEKKDTIAMLALELKGMLTSAATFATTTATKLAAQLGFNVAKGTEAVLTQGGGDPYTAFPRMAAMAAAVAALGVAIGSISGGSTGSFTAANNGTGTVFGDSEAQSASISNSIDILSENSDLMLPLTSAMLRSLKNIESSIGGVTNLILRQATGQGFNIQGGFTQNGIGNILQKSIQSTFDVLFLGDFLGIGKALGGLVGGLFGSKTTVKGQGLFGGAQSLGDILSGGFDLQEYIDIQVKKKTLGVTTSTKNKTQFSAANKELENQFTLIFGGFYDSILSATDILGANTEEVKKKLESAIINIGKIDLRGLNGQQIQERLEAVFGAAADSLAQQGFAGLEDFQSVGEGYYETLIKVATGVEQAKYFTDRLNVTAVEYTDILNKQGDVAAEIVRQSVLLNESTKDIKGGFYDLVNSFDGTAEELTDFVLTLRDLQDQLFMTGKNADYLTSAMILGAGGLDSLASGLDAYFEMLSPAEQAAELTRRLTNEFAIFGKELPSDVKAFRDLVSSIDISTEAGQKLYGQIIALAPEFNDLQDAIKKANDDVNALVKSLRDLAEQARAARGETEQPRNLAYLRNEFNKASELALQGDTEAAARLVSLGKDLMTMSKLYAVSGSDYAKDLAFIQGIATAVADLQESGLGTSISSDLKPSTGTGTTTPTVETVNNSTDARLDALSEKLEAGLFAIAKYTQDSASRLERWDDGGRMMVGIQPENGDTPIPVVVTP